VPSDALAAEEPRPSFGPLPRGGPARALCLLDEDTLAVATDAGLLTLSRGLLSGPPEQLPFAARRLACRVVAADRRLAAVGKQYAALRRAGNWTIVQHPAGLHFVGTAIDAAGEVWAAAERGALMRVTEAGLEAYSYPSDETRARALVQGPASGLAVLGEGRALWWFDGKAFQVGRAFDEPRYTGVPLLDGWFDADRGLLWVVAGGQEIASTSWRGNRLEDRISFRVGADAARIGGGPTPRGRSKVVATANHLYFQSDNETSWTPAPDTDRSAVHDLRVDPHGGRIYLAGDRGVWALDVPPPPPASQQDSQILPRAGFRVITGPLFHLTNRVDTLTTYSLELSGSFRATVLSGGDDLQGFMIAPEVGFVYDASGAAGSHFGQVGLAMGYDAFYWGVHWVPRFVLGSANGRLALGARHGILAETFWGLVNVELSHQMLVVDGTLRHDLRLNFGVDLYVIVYMAWVGRLVDALD
jgi:hypothetical protein